MPPDNKDPTPEDIAALVKRRMIESAPDVDLYQYLDLDVLEREIAAYITEGRQLSQKVADDG